MRNEPIPESRKGHYCRARACQQACKDAVAARAAAGIKNDVIMPPRPKKPKKPTPPTPAKTFTFMALLPMQNERTARAVDPTDWAAMEKAAAEASRVMDEQKAKARLAAKAAEAAAAEAQAMAASAAREAAGAEKVAQLERELEAVLARERAEKRKRDEAERERPQQQPPPSPQTVGRRNMAAAAALMPPPGVRASPARAARPVPAAQRKAVRSLLLQEGPCAGIPEVTGVEYEQHDGVLGEGAMGKVLAGSCANLAGDRVNVAIKMLRHALSKRGGQHRGGLSRACEAMCRAAISPGVLTCAILVRTTH